MLNSAVKAMSHVVVFTLSSQKYDLCLQSFLMQNLNFDVVAHINKGDLDTKDYKSFLTSPRSAIFFALRTKTVGTEKDHSML